MKVPYSSTVKLQDIDTPKHCLVHSYPDHESAQYSSLQPFKIATKAILLHDFVCPWKKPCRLLISPEP